jgi:hypothetical protein
MATTTTKIGFVGLGHMGGNMAARFLAAGYTVYGESRDRGDADDLVHEGLEWRDTPRKVADVADVLITSVPNDDVLESVASGPPPTKPGWINTSGYLTEGEGSPRTRTPPAVSLDAEGRDFRCRLAAEFDRHLHLQQLAFCVLWDH